MTGKPATRLIATLPDRDLFRLLAVLAVLAIGLHWGATDGARRLAGEAAPALRALVYWGLHAVFALALWLGWRMTRALEEDTHETLLPLARAFAPEARLPAFGHLDPADQARAAAALAGIWARPDVLGGAIALSDATPPRADWVSVHSHAPAAERATWAAALGADHQVTVHHLEDIESLGRRRTVVTKFVWA